MSVGLGEQVWQRGFHDRAMRQEDDARAIARYTVGNPLRAGRTQELGAYSRRDSRLAAGAQLRCANGVQAPLAPA